MEQMQREYINELIICIEECVNLLEYPYEKYKEVIQYFGAMFSESEEFDRLIDAIAKVSEIRNSELSAGQTFLNRGFQKLKGKLNKDAIIYFGKAVRKLAKQESEDDLYFALKGLGHSYEAVGLLWASNNCHAAALAISLKSWFHLGVINNRSYSCAKNLAENELLLGRLPSFLNWHELLVVLNQQLDVEKDQEVSFYHFRDSCLAICILNAGDEIENQLQLLPDLLKDKNLEISWLACHFRLGNIDLIRNDLAQENIKTDSQITDFFKELANQPFKDQIASSLTFMAGESVEITSTILGCKFHFRIKKNAELLITCEMLLAFFEGFLATSFDGVYPHRESIIFNVSKTPFGNFIQLESYESEYHLKINNIEKTKPEIINSMVEIISQILSQNFFIEHLSRTP